MAKEVRMRIYTTYGNSMYMNLVSVQVNYVWKMKVDFQIPSAPQYFESDLHLYNVSDWEQHKRNKIENILAYNRWQPVYSKTIHSVFELLHDHSCETSALHIMVR